jgi:hypothetical protein
MAIRKGTVGFHFRFRIKHVDANNVTTYPALTDISKIKIVFIKPAGSDLPPVFRQPVFLNNGADAWVAWTTEARTDLDVVGDWQAWAFLDIPGFNGASDPYAFSVADVPFDLPALS